METLDARELPTKLNVRFSFGLYALPAKYMNLIQ